MSSVCPLLAEASLSCLTLQMGFWNSWMDANALTRDCLTLLLSLQTLSQLLGVFYVLIYWLLYIFNKTIWVDTSNSLLPTSHTSANSSLLVTEQQNLSSITQCFVSDLCAIFISCDRCSVYLIFLYKGGTFLMCDLTVAGKPTCLCPPGHSIAGYWGMKEHLLGLKAASYGRCFGSAQGWRCW